LLGRPAIRNLLHCVFTQNKSRLSMAMFQITCIELPDGQAASGREKHEEITGFGGNAWHASTAAVIDDIESGRNIYYVRKDGRNFLVSVGDAATGKFLRTRDDGQWTNLLLELPVCRKGQIAA
jgi:hypothetical protein